MSRYLNKLIGELNLKESFTEIDDFLLEQKEMSPLIYTYLRNRNRSKFRFKILQKANQRILLFQSDRNDFIRGEFVGKRITGYERHDSVKSLDDYATEKLSQGFRMLTRGEDIIKFLKVMQNGLIRLSSAPTGELLIVLAACMYVGDILTAGEDARSMFGGSELIGFDEGDLIWMGRGWFRTQEKRIEYQNELEDPENYM